MINLTHVPTHTILAELEVRCRGSKSPPTQAGLEVVAAHLQAHYVRDDTSKVLFADFARHGDFRFTTKPVLSRLLRATPGIAVINGTANRVYVRGIRRK